MRLWFAAFAAVPDADDDDVIEAGIREDDIRLGVGWSRYPRNVSGCRVGEIYYQNKGERGGVQHGYLQ